MKRSFYQYIHFFINDPSKFGSIARIVAADNNFPKECTPAEGYDYMCQSNLYADYKLSCEELFHRYQYLQEDILPQ